MSAYHIAPRVTLIPIGLQGNCFTIGDKKRPFEAERKILHSRRNLFQQWIKTQR